VLALGCVLAAAAAAGAQGTEEGAFVVRVGRDTVQVEHFSRSPEGLVVDLESRRPPLRQRYRLSLTPDARAPRLEMDVWAPGSPAGSAPAQSAVLRLEGASAFIEQNAQEMELPTFEGALPFVNPSFSLVEQVLRRARALGGATVPVPVFLLSGAQSLTAEVRWVGADSAVVTVAGNPVVMRVDAVGRILGGRLAGAEVERVAGLLLGGPDRSVSERSEPPAGYGAPPGAAYTDEEVRVATEEGHELVGTLTLPRGARGRLPVVLLLTGSGLQDRDNAVRGLEGYRPFRQIADVLSSRGMAVLRLDDRGQGASGGDLSSATTASFAADARAAVTYLRARPEIDPERVALAGHGEGGVIALMLGAADPRIRALALMATPARAGLEVSLLQSRHRLESRGDLHGARLDSALLVARAALEGQKTRSPWLRFYLEHDPAPDAARVRASVLVLHGTTDREVPVTQAEELHALLQPGPGRRKRLEVFPGHNHLLLHDPSGDVTGYGALEDRLVPPEVLDPLVDWLARELL
jgi:uncharacterized protein